MLPHIILSLFIGLSHSIWVDTYNTYWQTPGLGPWQSLPIGNGDFTANVWLQDTAIPNPNPIDSASLFLLVSPCINSTTSSINNQTWIYNSTTKLLSNNDQCAISTGNSNPIETTSNCDPTNNALLWQYNSTTKLFISISKGTCLSIYDGPGPLIYEYKCFGSTNMQWILSPINTGIGYQISSVRYPQQCLTATAWTNEYDVMMVFGKSDTYDLTGERLKLSQLRISFDPPINNATTFKQSLYLSNSTVIIMDDNYKLTIFIDKNGDRLHLETESMNGKQFNITARILSWRAQPNFGPGGPTGEHFCSQRDGKNVPIVADTIVNNGCSGSKNEAKQIIFYHRNNYQNNGQSEFDFNIKLQQLESVQNEFKDPYYNLTWGGLLYLSDSKRNGFQNGSTSMDLSASLSAMDVTSSLLTFNVLTEQTMDINTWISDVCKNNENTEYRKDLHNTEWIEFWNRSWIEIGLNQEDNDTLYLVSELYTAQRYLDALDGFAENHAIKFNGQSFTISAGSGPDYKQWASGYWFQNTREPYYNTLVSGDEDMNIGFYNMYLNMIPMAKARNLLWRNHSGGWFGETTMIDGLFQESTYGYLCGTVSTINPMWNVIMWIRYYWSGTLEIINIILDEYAWYGDDNIVTKYLLPFSDMILNHYIGEFKEINKTTGKIIMYPSQSLETWQCPDTPPNASNCVVNPVEQIAGLKTITQRLLDLPSKFGTAEERALWKQILTTFPDINIITDESKGELIWPGLVIPPSNTNHENTELYTVHPFRMYQWFKPNLSLAINTYKNRRFPCNDGWCQDILDAAMLGLIDDASNMVIQRAMNAKQGLKWRWDGFTGHFQDYEPSSDHLEWMRTAIHYMLIQNDVNNINNNIIYLLPTWPCNWSVNFKLHAKNNTIVILDYDGVNKKLNNLTVEPNDRMKDVKFVNCVSNYK